MAQGKTKALTMHFKVLETISQTKYHEPATNVALEMTKSTYVLLFFRNFTKKVRSKWKNHFYIEKYSLYTYLTDVLTLQHYGLFPAAPASW